ncbi:cbb3-type cytochrome c oxidase N-terminal domain-containing protein [Roseimaritima sediminicola]|uniref:cbb3-type cytochrome c oxidase N-terminal domain-containing protein n=1 Tax=Roseimaritima sediminicola TaxID=2662066 RepID=UPI00129843D3|nr:cbb3-type cytochrome c oxidase N-terminal domain-containing protein [Roseimaritima sediminicola]
MSDAPLNDAPANDGPLTDHSYDGIQEFDNPLPGWWKWLFIATIVFSPFYWVYYHSGVEGRDVIAQHDAALAETMRLQFAEIGELQPDAATIAKYMHDEKWVGVGRSVFEANCIQCHGREGQGEIGPNLTDEHFKNVRGIEDLATVVIKGAGNGAMPAWANRLQTNEIVLVAAYVASLRGQNLPGPRGPEGRKIPPWPDPPAEPDASEEATAAAAPPES